MNINQKGFANIVVIVLAVIVVGTLGYVILKKNSASPITSPGGNGRVTQETPHISKIESSAYSLCCVQIYGEHFVADGSNDVIWVNKTTQMRFWGYRWFASRDGLRLLNAKYIASQFESPAESESRKYEIHKPLVLEGDYDVIVVNSQGQSAPYSISISWKDLDEASIFPPQIETVSMEAENKLTITGIFAGKTVNVRFKDKSTLALVAEVKQVAITGKPATNETSSTEKAIFLLPPSLKRGTEYLISLSNKYGEDNNSIVFMLK